MVAVHGPKHGFDAALAFGEGAVFFLVLLLGLFLQLLEDVALLLAVGFELLFVAVLASFRLKLVREHEGELHFGPGGVGVGFAQGRFPFGAQQLGPAHEVFLGQVAHIGIDEHLFQLGGFGLVAVGGLDEVLHGRDAGSRVALLRQPLGGAGHAAVLVAIVGVEVAGVVKPGGQQQVLGVVRAQFSGRGQGAGFLGYRGRMAARVVSEGARQLPVQQLGYVGFGHFHQRRDFGFGRLGWLVRLVGLLRLGGLAGSFNSFNGPNDFGSFDRSHSLRRGQCGRVSGKIFHEDWKQKKGVERGRPALNAQPGAEVSSGAPKLGTCQKQLPTCARHLEVTTALNLGRK